MVPAVGLEPTLYGISNRSLCRLGYAGVVGHAGIEPAVSALRARLISFDDCDPWWTTTAFAASPMEPLQGIKPCASSLPRMRAIIYT